MMMNRKQYEWMNEQDSQNRFWNLSKQNIDSHQYYYYHEFEKKFSSSSGDCCCCIWNFVWLSWRHQQQHRHGTFISILFRSFVWFVSMKKKAKEKKRRWKNHARVYQTLKPEKNNTEKNLPIHLALVWAFSFPVVFFWISFLAFSVVVVVGFVGMLCQLKWKEILPGIQQKKNKNP